MTISKEIHSELLKYFSGKLLKFKQNPITQVLEIRQSSNDMEFDLFDISNKGVYYNSISVVGLISDIIILKDNNRDHYEYIINNYPEILY